MKKILNIILGLVLLSGITTFAQTNGSFKSVRFYNVPDSAAFLATTWANFIAAYPNSGGIYYNEQSTKFRIYENGSWRDLGGSGGGGGLTTASNGLNTPDGIDVQLGGTLSGNISIAMNNSDFRFSDFVTPDDLSTVVFPSKAGGGIQTAGINLGTFTSDPGTLSSGDLWNFNGQHLMTRINGTRTILATTVNINNGVPYAQLLGGRPSIDMESTFTYTPGTNTLNAERITTSPTATTPGLNFGSFAGDPSAPINGDVWYNSTSNVFRFRQNGISASLGDMILANTQTVTGAKTFLNNAFLLRNPANTFSYTINGGAILANRTINIPVTTATDEFSLLGVTQTYTGKKTFTPNATTAGMNIGGVSGNPSTPITGDFWVDSSVGYIKAYNNAQFTNVMSLNETPNQYYIPFGTNTGIYDQISDLQYSLLSNSLIIGNTTPININSNSSISGHKDGFSLFTNTETSGAGGDLTITAGGTSQAGQNGGHLRLSGGTPGAGGTVGYIILTNIPTSSAGLPSGAIWSNAGVLTIVP